MKYTIMALSLFSALLVHADDSLVSKRDAIKSLKEASLVGDTPYQRASSVNRCMSDLERAGVDLSAFGRLVKVSEVYTNQHYMSRSSKGYTIAAASVLRAVENLR